MPATLWISLTLAFTALVLAFFFHRQRVAQIALLLMLVAASRLEGDSGRVGAAALAFVPWLCIVVAVLPESRWLARSQLALILLIVSLVALAMRAPAHILIDVSRVFRDALPGQDPLVGAAWVVAAAGLLCVLRYILRAAISEMTAAVALTWLAGSILRWWHGAQADTLLSVAAISMLIGVLYGSYRMAFVDALTGLPNRRSLDESLDRLGSRYVLAMVDVDHFKSFNDTHGHAAGDIVLREVGALLRRHSNGRAFRYGGEEFCVVFEDVDSSSAAEGCERARDALEKARIRVRPAVTGSKKLSKPQDVSVTASFGLAARNAEQKRAKEVLASADKALYKAKSKGRNRVEVGK